MGSNYQFIGPLKPGQKPYPVNKSHGDDEWSIFDLLKPQAEQSSSLSSNHNNNNSHINANSSSAGSRIGKVRKPKKYLRAAGGTVWEDPTLAEWDPDDYRIFVGDLGNDVTDELLKSTFETYPSFVKAKVVREKRSGKSKGYGFISFKDPLEYARAIREWDGKYLGCRPIKLRKSQWSDRAIETKKNKITGVGLPEFQAPDLGVGKQTK